MGKEFRGGRNNNRGGGRGGNRGGKDGQRRGGIGNKKFSKPKVDIQKHRFDGVFIMNDKKNEQLLLTLNMVPGESVYGEKRINIENKTQLPDGTGDKIDKIEYRVWNVFRSKLGVAIVNGIKNIYMEPGSKVLYLGAANGTTISHVSDLIGPEGIVYGVEISKRSGRDLLNMAKKRTNIVPIIDDARKPQNYRFLIPTQVDCIFADVATPNQAEIIGINAKHFLKNKGGFVFSIKAACVDSTAEPEAVFADQIKILKTYGLIAKEQVSLEPFERGHAVVSGIYKPKHLKNLLSENKEKSKEKEKKKEKKEKKEEDEDDE